MQQTEKTRC